jgi:hypothetical protein
MEQEGAPGYRIFIATKYCNAVFFSYKSDNTVSEPSIDMFFT